MKLDIPFEFNGIIQELELKVDAVRFNGLKAGQRNDQEVTAEFSGAVICHLMGYRVPLGNVKDYIEHYSFKERI